jgi:hypothetical protein
MIVVWGCVELMIVEIVVRGDCEIDRKEKGVNENISARCKKRERAYQG